MLEVDYKGEQGGRQAKMEDGGIQEVSCVLEGAEDRSKQCWKRVAGVSRIRKKCRQEGVRMALWTL